MTENLILLAAVAGPAAILLLLRSNAALAFLALCLGSVLAQVVAKDTLQLSSAFLPNGGLQDPNYVTLGLLLVPAILTTLFTTKTVKGFKSVLQLIPAIGIGATGFLLARPYLPANFVTDITTAPYWSYIDNFQVIIVGLSAFACMLIVWGGRPKRTHPDEHAKH